MQKDKETDRRRKKTTKLAEAAFGCNREAQEKIEEFFEANLKDQTFFFYEYFCLNPIIISEKEERKIQLVAPFLERILTKSDFVPNPDHLVKIREEFEKERFFRKYDDVGFVPNSSEIIFKWRNKIPAIVEDMQNSTYLGSRIYNVWKNPPKKKEPAPEEQPGKYYMQLKSISFKNEPKKWYDCGYFTLQYLDNDYLKDMYKKDSPCTDKFCVLLEFLNVVYPWLRTRTGDCQKDILKYLVVPIASKNIFFGYFILFHQIMGDEKTDENIAEILCRVADDIYLPVLTLFENYWNENELKDYLSYLKKKKQAHFCELENCWKTFKEGFLRFEYTTELSTFQEDLNNCIISEDLKKEFRDIGLPLSQNATVSIEEGDSRWQITDDREVRIIKKEGDKLNIHTSEVTVVFANACLKNSKLSIEEKLCWLWEKRYDLVMNQTKNNKKLDEVIKQLNDSLIFARYMVAAPGSIKQVEKAMTLDLNKVGDSLPAALVIGGPGSGKEKMAHLIALFSEKYTFKPVHVINMALLRPNEIVPMLLMGGEIIGGYQTMDTTQQKEQGKQEKREMSIEGILEKAEDNEATFILDELNSMDIDSQGALLRLLESGELVKIGSLNKGKKERELNYSFIGVMNEDPEKLTRQPMIENILRNRQIFGGMLGDVMYEFFRRLRRLRGDLYTRMKRGGMIEIKDLRERREDIPILFSVFVDEERKGDSKCKEMEIYIHFDVFDLLTSPDYDWPGNVRQLQSVARVSFIESKKDLNENDSYIRILKRHVRTALEAEKSLSREWF